ncbi:MAG: carboxypeptidase-like regulatory domain-containing protein, partial [Bacteroidales bacterium]|nr:carboxypeptidase-like regulatory domain-containing protein [Bacteroidales bacterium]
MCALFLSLGNAWAQDITVTGKVTDKSGEPIVGVYVLVENTTIGTSTDLDGAYSLTAPSTAKLVYTSMGYKDAVVDVNGRAVIDVVMEDDALLLDDVVVTALGVKKERKALGYSVTEMKSTELLRNKQTNVVNSLAGKVAGVNITQSGGAAG